MSKAGAFDFDRKFHTSRKTASKGIARRAMAFAALILGGGIEAASAAVPEVDARVVALNIPGASAVAQIGTFLNDPTACARPIPTLFPDFIKPGAVLYSERLLVGSRSNFGAPRAGDVGREGSFLSIDPSAPETLSIPGNFARNGGQASTLGGRVQMFSANSPGWRNNINNPMAFSGPYTGVSNPLGLSNNNAFGRIWPANAPFGDDGVGSSTILDPTGLPLKGAPNPLIGGVYVDSATNRSAVFGPQVIDGVLTAAVGTAFLGPSPDGTCKAVFAVVTADGAIVQEHTVKGLDGLAPEGTVQPLLSLSWHPPSKDVEPRLGVIMNPYVQKEGVVLQLFVSEPFNNTIAIIDLVVFGTAPNQVFGLGAVNRISSPRLNLPVDLAPAEIETESNQWASNTTLEDGSDFYVANRGDNTILRMRQDGSVVAVRRVDVDHGPLNNAVLNGLAASADGTKIYATVTGPGRGKGGLIELPAFGN